MFGDVNLIHELTRLRKTKYQEENLVVSEAKKILHRDLFTRKKILENLQHYSKSFYTLDEEDLDMRFVFSVEEIKRIAVLYRLKFLDSRFFKPDLPYEAHIKLEELNIRFRKEIRDYKILSHYENFSDAAANYQAVLLVETNYGNYYLLHLWGKTLKQARKLKCFPLRNFETLISTVIIATLVLAVSIPTDLITLDRNAGYWSGYRAAAFFHLLIFNSGVTVYFTFAFSKNFSSTVWNRYKDFD